VEKYCVKTPVFPFVKFPGVDPKLSPEMKSTGEVMGIADDFGTAFYKAQLAAGVRLPMDGAVFMSANNRDKRNLIPIARKFIALGFKVVGTSGTARALRDAGLPAEELWKVSEGRPNCVDAIRNRQIDLIINTPLGETSFKDGWAIRTAAIQHNVPCITTLSGASAAAEAIAALRHNRARVICLQELHRES
jgi:carbamoyl-phosphate synthase large subunit